MYTKENLKTLKKKYILFLILSIVSIAAFLATFFIFLFLATRENKNTFKVIGSISIIVLICAFILLLSLTIDTARKINQFTQIMEKESVVVKGKYLGKKDYTVTLQDKSIVYELSFMTDTGEKIFYLVTLFDYPFIIGERYSLKLVDEFIKEIDHEK